MVLAALTLALCLGAVALLVRWGNAKERSRGLLALGVGLCGVALPALLAIVGIDAIKEKNLVGVLPPLLIAAAAGFGARNSGHLGLAGGVALVAVFSAGLIAMVTTPRLRKPRLAVVGRDPRADYGPSLDRGEIARGRSAASLPARER